RYKDGSGTYEAGLVPTVYGRAMSDGKAVVIRPPDACGGETTANSKVPADFMPVIVVYDDAKTLGFGTAYISDEAYESPLSLMKFGSATIESATRAEFDEFRKNGPPNVVTRESYHSFQDDKVLQGMGLKRVWPAFARECWALRRFRIPEEAREKVAAFWPPERSIYWSAPMSEGRAEIRRVFSGYPLQRDDGGPARTLDSYSAPEFIAANGVASRSGGGTIRGQRYVPSYYPVESGISADKWKTDPENNIGLLENQKQVLTGRVDVQNGRYRGFAYCYESPGHVIWGELARYLDKVPVLISRVDEDAVDGTDRRWRIPTREFYEKDEFYYRPFEFWIDSTRGDV
ncbi:MAG: hypothetical protein AB7F76_08440, partial [Parvibaculaceae bacterium]